MNAHAEHVYRQARRYVDRTLSLSFGHDQAYEHDDYIHDVFLRFLIKGLPPLEQPVSHVCTRARYRVLDVRDKRLNNKSASRHRRGRHWVPFIEAEDTPVDARLDDVIAASEALRQVDADQWGRALILEAMGYDEAELARMYDCTTSAIRSRMYRARIRVRMRAGLQPE